MRATALFQNRHGFVETHRFLVWSFGSQGIKHIGNGKDTGIQRNIFALLATKIAAAIKFLMMMTDYLFRILKPGRACHDVHPVLHMGFHFFKLSFIQPPRFK